MLIRQVRFVTPLAVVAGIIRQDGRILVARRKAKDAQALKWEFPGGKIEPGETPEAALERELFEELGIRTRTGRIYDAKLFSYPEKTVLILFYFSEILEGKPAHKDTGGFEWTDPCNIMNYDFAGADTAVAERLAGEDAIDAE